MTGRCRDCRHWGSPDDDDQYTDTGANFFRVQQSYGSCDAIPYYDDETPTTDAVMNTWGVTTGHYSVLYTRPEFGCTLFKPRTG